MNNDSKAPSADVAYFCHICGKETPPPAPFKFYVKCSCGATTAASAAMVEQPGSAAVEPIGYVLSINEVINSNWASFAGKNKSQRMAAAEGMRDNYISNCRPINLPKLELVPLYLDAPTKPQRITEQDARELLKNFVAFWDSGSFPLPPSVDLYLDRPESQALLAKLNENREPDYKAIR